MKNLKLPKQERTCVENDIQATKEVLGVMSLYPSKMNKDNVNHPSHYTSGKVECIEAIESATESLKGIEAVCTANVIKYMWRWKHKNGVEDLKKARWYLDKLISLNGGTEK